MRPYNEKNIIPVNTRMNATINSVAIQVYNVFTFSIQIVFTGTPTGTFKLQASDDAAYSGIPNANGSGLNVAPVNWSDVDNASFTVAAAGNVMWNYSNPGYNWVRVVYTDGSGAGSTAVIASSTVNCKGF